MVVHVGDIPGIIYTCFESLTAAGLVIRSPISAGSDGYVYVSSPGKVIKFSVSSYEARIAKYLINHSHPALPTIDAVWDLSEICQVAPPFYAIVRENVPDLDEPVEMAPLMTFLNHLLYAASDKYLRQTDFVNYANLTRSNLQRIAPNRYQKRQYERIRKLAAWMRRIGLYGGDFGGSNWGERHNGDLVIRDFSQFSFSPERPNIIIPKLRPEHRCHRCHRYY